MGKGIYTLTSKSPRDRSIKARSAFVAEEILLLLNTIGDVAIDEKWDGREMVLGTALAYRTMCNNLGINAEMAINIMEGMGDAMPGGGRAPLSRLVAPNGRPLAMPPSPRSVKPR